MPSLNLIRDRWIPAVMSSGERRLIRPADIGAPPGADHVTDILWPRADFRVATLEFFIGLLTTAFPPEGDSGWRKWWDNPPSPEELAEGLEPYAIAFDFDGPGRRFLQDSGDLGGEASPVSGLLIDQPGANTEKNNADLFVKRGKAQTLARSTAAIALYTMQTFAPSGGAGHRTGLRGGGPLTTLAFPPDGDGGRRTLWHRLWLNVTTLFDPLDDGEPLDEPEKTFPWLGKTRVSDRSGVKTTQTDIHPAQCFWGAPRRISLVFEENAQKLACDVTGAVEDVVVRGYYTRPYGVNYENVEHPLTPYYRVKPTAAERLPVHPQPGGIAYRHWLGFVQQQQSETRFPAKCIGAAGKRLTGKASLAMFGYDMDNMKARGFVEAQMPLLIASDQEKQDALEKLASRMADAATEVAGLTISQIKAAKGGSASGLDLIRETFFKETETAFFVRLKDGLDLIEAGSASADLLTGIGMEWLNNALAKAALGAFDRHVQVNAVVANADMKAIKRAADARAILGAALKGYGPSGRGIFGALGASAPKQKKKAKKGGGK
jgi:CRISPR system Cascade subunit CasA